MTTIPEIIEDAAQLRAALDLDDWPWLWSGDVDPAARSRIPEPRYPALPVWGYAPEDDTQDLWFDLAGFVGALWSGNRYYGYGYEGSWIQEQGPVVDSPADLLGERIKVAFKPPAQDAPVAIGTVAGMLRAGQVLRRTAYRLDLEQLDRWDGQAVVVRKIRAEIAAYGALADQYDAAATDVARLCWDDYRALVAAQEDAGGGPVTIETMPISIN